MRTVRKLKRNVVSVITYDCPDCGDGGTIEGFWTGEIDTWGKYTIQPIDGSATLYLFARELVSVEEY